MSGSAFVFARVLQIAERDDDQKRSVIHSKQLASRSRLLEARSDFEPCRADRWAIVCSLITSAKLNDREPYTHLRRRRTHALRRTSDTADR